MIEVRTLVVDDEPLLLEDLKWAVTQVVGGNVATADSAAQARSLIDESDFDLVVTDLWMENRDSGLEVISAATDKDRWTQVILVTAFGRPDPTHSKAIAAGAYDFVDRTAPGNYLQRLNDLIVQALKRREQRPQDEPQRAGRESQGEV